MLKIYKEHQHKIIEYISAHYDNVTILIQERWIQLDFHKYSQMSSEDMRKGIQDLYEFMKNYEYLQKMSEIKCKVYEDAVKMMKLNKKEQTLTEEETIVEL